MDPFTTWAIGIALGCVIGFLACLWCVSGPDNATTDRRRKDEQRWHVDGEM